LAGKKDRPFNEIGKAVNAMNLANETPADEIPAAGNTFASRIKLLIQRVGSATEIARKCGFSEGVVRSWRDGHTDPSRGRCVTLAKTLGISLVWLVAGEGPIQLDPATGGNDDAQTSAESFSRTGRLRNSGTHAGTVDSQRLAAAMKILQSNLQLAESRLSLSENTDLLAELYDAMGPNGVIDDAEAMVAFNQHLSERIRQSRRALA
jgi:hypothetical protein